jgi:dTDP-4-dehydrorhamnose reductase
MLITGGTGILGRELLKIFPDSVHPTHSELELSDRDKVFEFLKKNRVDKIVHSAALTEVRECEENKPKAWKYNVQATENLVDASSKYCSDVYFLYISTPAVFDGRFGMYNENDIPYPKNFYALTKLLGEFAVKKISNYLIVRTNFVAMEKWKYPKAFTDRYGTYLFARDVATGIRDVIENKLQGIVHVVGDTKMSMFELAKSLSPDVAPITIDDYDGPPLPMDMSIDTIRWKKYRMSY